MFSTGRISSLNFSGGHSGFFRNLPHPQMKVLPIYFRGRMLFHGAGRSLHICGCSQVLLSTSNC